MGLSDFESRELRRGSAESDIETTSTWYEIFNNARYQ